ncbi:unnamed protein product [Didymodactylos carnosus]|uniref:Uncharacterized protein n=1 Tax=Didymodactylos carnosus TaxID=1234261 RepID=A0A814ZSC0_9BILA|nr:unnamed protein product [Didymodactylos carnosus]CAF1489464.1 unnamed protein product [Didymodactylos carnosus]CAF4011417.1 unnamed protein product [Didymodactylos carnosus]CAF4278844.1 unnamed protein product [Didymodactylos carnosus]
MLRLQQFLFRSPLYVVVLVVTVLTVEDVPLPVYPVVEAGTVMGLVATPGGAVTIAMGSVVTLGIIVVDMVVVKPVDAP